MSPDAGQALDDAGRARLCAAAGRDVDPHRSLFPPETITWRVNREAAVLLGGGRALLLQVAHPLVAAGVAAHSDFRRRPLDRLWRTLDLMLTIVFADAAAALAAARAIDAVHARVRGTLDAAVGSFPRGTPYDARDPALLLWVFATLADTALLVYERFVAALSPAERDTYWQEAKVTARLLGIPDDRLPPTLADFTRYVEEMVAGDVLAVGPAGRDIAASILHPPVPIGLRQALRATSLLTVGLLPPTLRARYGLAWGAAGETALAGIAGASRWIVPFVPAFARVLPHARRG